MAAPFFVGDALNHGLSAARRCRSLGIQRAAVVAYGREESGLARTFVGGHPAFAHRAFAQLNAPRWADFDGESADGFLAPLARKAS